MTRTTIDVADIPSDLKAVPRRNLTSLLKRINRSATLSERDYQTLASFYQKMKTETMRNENFGGHHLYDLLADCTRLAEHNHCLTATLADGPQGEAAVKRLEQWVADKDYSGYVADDYYSSMRLFAGFMTDGDRLEWPDRFAALPVGMRGSVDPAPQKTNILTYAEAGAMAQDVFNVRDPATIMVSWGTGGRPMSELWPLQFRDIEDKGDHFIISFPDPTKTGKRDIELYVGSPQLRKWIKHHPANEEKGSPDPEDYVWAKTTANEHISYTMYREIFYSAGERAGITKSHNPQHFRHSRASVLASRKYVSQVDLENHFGWVRGSDSAQHYISRFGGETERHIAQADGVPVDEDAEPDPIAPIVCLTCDQWTPRYSEHCIWCEADVDPDATITLDDMADPTAGEKDLLTLVLDGDVNARDLLGVKRLLPVIRSRPAVLDRVDELITMLKRIEGDDNAKLLIH